MPEAVAETVPGKNVPDRATNRDRKPCPKTVPETVPEKNVGLPEAVPEKNVGVPETVFLWQNRHSNFGFAFWANAHFFG